MARYIATVAGGDQGDLRSDSQIGIGTDPAAKVDILSTGGYDAPVIRLRQSQPYPTYGIDLGIDNLDNGGLFFRTKNGNNFANAMVIARDSGNIGMGPDATSPKGLLQLNKSYIVAPAPSGDITGATDRGNIIAAINAVTPNSPTATAGTVYLQAGLYYVNNTITLPKGLVLIGAGYSHSNEGVIGTVIRMVNAATGTSVLQISSANHVSIKNLSIDSTDATPNYKYTGISIENLSNLINVENVSIIKMRKGIFVSGSDNIFTNIHIDLCDTGVILGDGQNPGTQYAHANNFYGGSIGTCVGCGVDVSCGCQNLLSGVNVSFNGSYCVNLEHVSNNDDGTTLMGCYFENYSNKPIRIASKRNRIIGCWINGADPIEWDLNNCGTTNVIFGNYFNDVVPTPPLDLILPSQIQCPAGWNAAGQEARLEFGDYYQQVKAVKNSGLIFQTYDNVPPGPDNNAFRWKNHTGSEWMTLMGHSGMLGINETAPTHKLTVTGSAQNDIVWGERIRNADTAYVSPYSSGAGILFTINEYPGVSKVAGIAGVSENQWGNSFGLRFFSGNNVSTPKMTINGDGNVGINTTQPVSKLHIEIGSAGTASIGQVASNYAMFVPAVQGQDKFQGIIGIGESGDHITAAIGTYDDNAGGAQGLWLATGNNSGLYDRVHIDSNGNVGIGNIHPGAKLDVQGGTAASGNNGIGIILKAQAGNGTNKNGGDVTINGGANTGTGTYGRVILASDGGAVGIGTSSPSSTVKLDVNGNINVASGSGYKVNGIKVVGSQQAHIADATGTLADITTKFNSLLAKLETHGLLASV
jgi:hypothetical protein